MSQLQTGFQCPCLIGVEVFTSHRRGRWRRGVDGQANSIVNSIQRYIPLHGYLHLAHNDLNYDAQCLLHPHSKRGNLSNGHESRSEVHSPPSREL